MKNTLAEIVSHNDASCFKLFKVYQQHFLRSVGDEAGQFP